ncbi:MAG: T9SS type A sorting domain-containing protein [Bacteroidetes bacterium]|nr:T9SS type A sorting domain-containing protein [Bacteroidota bacterium]
MKNFLKNKCLQFSVIILIFGLSSFGQNKPDVQSAQTNPFLTNILKGMVCPPVPPDIVYNSDFVVNNHHLFGDTLLTYSNVCSWHRSFGHVQHAYPSVYMGTSAYVLIENTSSKSTDWDSAGGFYQNNSINKNQFFTFHLKYMGDWSDKFHQYPLGVKKLIVCLTNDSVETLYQNGVIKSFNKQTILEFTDFTYQGWPIRDTTLNFSANEDYNRIFVYSYVTTSRQQECQSTWVFNVNLYSHPLYADAGRDTTISCGDTTTLGGNPSAWGGIPFLNNPYYKYSWSSIPSGFTSSVSNPIIHPNASTSYILTVTDSVNQIARDTVVVSVHGCITWPRYIRGFTEGFHFSCGTSGDILASIVCWDTIISFVHDTTIRNPYADSCTAFNSLVFFDQNSKRLWYHSFWAYASTVVQQLLVDNQRNSYILFNSPEGYSFYNGPSLTLQQWNWRQYLAKIDMHGTINWVQSFSPVEFSYDGGPIQSFCSVGDSIYLVGYSSHSIVATGKLESGLTHWDLGQNNEFICTIRKSTGDVDTIVPFSRQCTADSLNFITSLHDTLLVVQAGYFYLFNLASIEIKSPKKVFDPLYKGWLNNGNNKIISTPLGCAEESNGDFSQKWITTPTQYYEYSGFATKDYLYFLGENSSLIKLNLEDGTEYSVDTTNACFITGNETLLFGYFLKSLNTYPNDTIKLDTFGLPNGIPKSKIERQNSSTFPSKGLNNDQTISISPNPTTKLLYLNVNSNYQGKINSIEIFNSSGNSIKNIEEISINSGYKIDLNGYPDGIYFVIIRTDTETQTKKIIKLE